VIARASIEGLQNPTPGGVPFHRVAHRASTVLPLDGQVSVPVFLAPALTHQTLCNRRSIDPALWRLTQIDTAADIRSALSEFAADLGCAHHEVKVVQITPNSGSPSPDAFAYAIAEARAHLGPVPTSSLILDSFGSIIMWRTSPSADAFLAGFTFVMQPNRGCVDVVISVSWDQSPRGLEHFDISLTRFSLLCQCVAAPSISALLLPDVAVRSKLSDRQIQCLQITSTGATTEEVSAVLGIGRRTVESHIQSAMRKLGTNKKAQAVAVAFRLGLIS
jgi:DNA-binding CsgD family transcriptional regulator